MKFKCIFILFLVFIVGLIAGQQSYAGGRYTFSAFNTLLLLSQPKTSLGDYVWLDSNGDGVQNAGEIGIGGVVVNLLNPDNTPVLDSSDNPVTTTTDNAGFYKFFNLTPGNYRLEFIPRAGYFISQQDSAGDDAIDSDANPVDGHTTVTTLAIGENDSTWDVGMYKLTASLGDYVWYDIDADGIQDPGEIGIGNVTVNLYNSVGSLVDTITTAGDGSYEFTVLPGYYSVRFFPPVGYLISPQDQGVDDALDSDPDPATGLIVENFLGFGTTHHTWDAGIYKVASLGDYVWNDSNANGIAESGENGIDNVTVNLYDGIGNLVGTTSTAGGGLYEFADLPPGNYFVEFIPPAGYSISPQDQGHDDTVDSDADPLLGVTSRVSLDSGENDSGWDAGMHN